MSVVNSADFDQQIAEEWTRSYNQNLWIGHSFEGAAYLPR
jgi:hypothetical protein